MCCLIFLGDSACRHGCDPIQFEKATGLKARTIGLSILSGASSYAILAEAYLRNHPRPRVFVLCLSVHAPAYNDGHDLMSARFVQAYGDRFNLPYFSRLGAVWFCSRIAGRSDVRDLPLTGLDSETYRSLERKILDSRGFFALRGRKGTDFVIPLGDPAGTRPNADWNSAIDRISAACKKAGVPLLIRLCPMGADEKGDFSEIEAWLAGLERRPGVHVARPILLRYDSSLMWDGIHLNARGVEKFAPVVAADVERVLAE